MCENSYNDFFSCPIVHFCSSRGGETTPESHAAGVGNVHCAARFVVALLSCLSVSSLLVSLSPLHCCLTRLWFAGALAIGPGGLGPAWTRGEVVQPLGEKGMGSLKARVYVHFESSLSAFSNQSMLGCVSNRVSPLLHNTQDISSEQVYQWAAETPRCE